MFAPCMFLQTDKNNLIELPSQWVTMAPDEAVRLEKVDSGKKEYKKLASDFRKSVATEVNILKVCLYSFVVMNYILYLWQIGIE